MRLIKVVQVFFVKHQTIITICNHLAYYKYWLSRKLPKSFWIYNLLTQRLRGIENCRKNKDTENHFVINGGTEPFGDNSLCLWRIAGNFSVPFPLLIPYVYPCSVPLWLCVYILRQSYPDIIIMWGILRIIIINIDQVIIKTITVFDRGCRRK